MSASLASLSADMVAKVASWLSPRDLRHAVFASDHLSDSPLYEVYCRHHLRLRFPMDPQACATLLAACERALAASRSLPAHVTLALPSQLDILTAVGMHTQVETIEIDPTRFSHGPTILSDRGWVMLKGLSRFPRLVCVVINTNSWVSQIPPLDVELLARAAPTLEVFAANGVRLQHEDAFASLQNLRRLDFEEVSVPSWRFAAGLARLEHFRCFFSNSTNHMNFSQWRPLKSIQLARCSLSIENFLRAIEQVHLPFLEQLHVFGPDRFNTYEVDLAARPSPRLVDLAVAPNGITGGIDILSTFIQLRSLHLCWDEEYFIVHVHDHGVHDASPLATLTHLETLKLRMSRAAKTCRPLRALTRLRELHLVDGWLRDFVDYLPLLEKLSVEEFGQLPRRRTFEERRHNGLDVGLGDLAPHLHLQEVFIGQSVVLNDYAMQLIRDAQSLRLEQNDLDWRELFRVNQLTRMTSFSFRIHSFECLPSYWEGETQQLESIHSLETLRLSFCFAELVDLPWTLEGATRLRVISLFKFGQAVLDTIAKWSASLCQLEELYLERFEGISLAPLLELHSLEVVGLDSDTGCQRLRSARGPGGALPHLRMILHNGKDCAWHTTCPHLPRFTICGDRF